MSVLFWGYFSRISSIASSLIIMPFALAQFSAETFSLWMVFVVFYGLIVVFDFGLTTTFARQYNYLLAGADSIEKSGISHTSHEKVSDALFTQLYIGSRKIFSMIAIIVGLLLALVYFYYFRPLTAEYTTNITLEWVLYSIAIIINLFCLTYNAIFFGTNNVASIYRVCSISNIVFFALAITLILFDYGLLAVAIARICSALIYYVHARLEVSTFNMLAHYDPKFKNGSHSVLRNLIPNAAKLGGVTLGNFLVGKASVLIVAAYLPLSESGAYSLALNIFSVIISISLLYMTIKTPLLNTFRQKSKHTQLLKLQRNIRKVCLIMGSVSFLAFIVLGDLLLNMIDSKTQLPSLLALVLFSLLYLLELNRNISMNFIMSSNKVPFLKASLITGAFCVGLTIVLFELNYTLIIVPIVVQLVAQSVFNNWYWTRQEFIEINLLSQKSLA
ncbi:hypothetical protein [Thalassotalea fusca]